MKFWKDLGSSEGQEGGSCLLLIFLLSISFLPCLYILLQSRPTNYCELGEPWAPAGFSSHIILLVPVGKAYTWACGVKVPMAVRLRG